MNLLIPMSGSDSSEVGIDRFRFYVVVVMVMVVMMTVCLLGGFRFGFVIVEIVVVGRGSYCRLIRRGFVGLVRGR